MSQSVGSACRPILFGRPLRSLVGLAVAAACLAASGARAQTWSMLLPEDSRGELAVGDVVALSEAELRITLDTEKDGLTEWVVGVVDGELRVLSSHDAKREQTAFRLERIDDGSCRITHLASGLVVVTPDRGETVRLGDPDEEGATLAILWASRETLPIRNAYRVVAAGDRAWAASTKAGAPVRTAKLAKSAKQVFRLWSLD